MQQSVVAGGRPLPNIGAFQQDDIVAAHCRIAHDPGTGSSASDNDEVSAQTGGGTHSKSLADVQ